MRDKPAEMDYSKQQNALSKNMHLSDPTYFIHLVLDLLSTVENQ